MTEGGGRRRRPLLYRCRLLMARLSFQVAEEKVAQAKKPKKPKKDKGGKEDNRGFVKRTMDKIKVKFKIALLPHKSPPSPELLTATHWHISEYLPCVHVFVGGGGRGCLTSINRRATRREGGELVFRTATAEVLPLLPSFPLSIKRNYRRTRKRLRKHRGLSG